MINIKKVDVSFINMGFLTKTNIANLNSGENPGNIVTVKKVQNSKMDSFAYVSGQAIRRYIKETMMDMGLKLTPVDKKGEPKVNVKKKLKGDNRKKAIIKEHPDLDLFGYMEPEKTRRWSPVKVSPLVSIHPLKGEFDYLTRKKDTTDKKSGDIVKVEVDPFNYMKGNIIIEEHRIGRTLNEFNYKFEDVVKEKERGKRINRVLESLQYFDGGAKQARLLEDLTPKFLVGTKQKFGTPIFLHALEVDEEGNLKTEPIIEVLEDYSKKIEKVVFGLRKNIFKNESDIIEEFKGVGKVLTINDAIEKLKV